MASEFNSAKQSLFIVAGEDSGDLYGGFLSHAIRKRSPEVQLLGMGGHRMEQEGVEILYNIRDTSVTGFLEVAYRIRSLWKIYRSIVSMLNARRPSAVILIDFPDFNLRLAKTAKELGIPVIYFIGPSIWAWRPGRLQTVLSHVDKMLVILPFEEELYRSAGVDVEYYGHPLLDVVRADLDREEFRKKYGFESGAEVVGVCPGSRPNEIRYILPVLLKALAALKRERKIEVVLPLAPSLPPAFIQDMMKGSDLGIRLVEGDTYNVMKNADFLIVASGTATVEAGLLGTPMISVYRMSPITFRIGVRWIRVKDYCMVNLILGRRVVPELIQSDLTPEKVCRETLKFLEDPELREAMRVELAKLSYVLGPDGSTDRLALSILRFLEKRQSGPCSVQAL